MGKFINSDGLTTLWSKIKTYVASVAATKQDPLVSGTNIKTINGQSVLGSGDITLDLSLYKVVDSLPTTGIDENKIYLIASSSGGTNNVYTEYMYVNSAWEKIGEYKSDVDLSAYAKTADVETALADKADASDVYTKSEVDAKVTASGTFSEADATKLAGVESGAEVNVIETVKVDGTALAVSDKAVDIDLSGKVDVEDGKGLSANDYTDEEKAKLAAIDASATADEALTDAEIEAAIAAVE